MKRVFATVGVFALVSGVAANAAIATYDFNNATIGTTTRGAGDATFDGGLAALGVTTATLANATGGTLGVLNIQSNAGGSTVPTNFAGTGNQAYSTGNNGSFTLVFGAPGVTQFAFDYWDTNIQYADPTGGMGFTAMAYDAANNLLGTIMVNNPVAGSTGATGGTSALSYSNLGAQSGNASFSGFSAPISKIVISDLGNDTTWLDNFSANLITPEPSSYLLIGSALAGLAAFRRRRVK